MMKFEKTNSKLKSIRQTENQKILISEQLQPASIPIYGYETSKLMCMKGVGRNTPDANFSGFASSE